MPPRPSHQREVHPTPLVSVVMPTFNRRPQLARAIEALAAQELDTSLEVVVISDGSTDGTDEYLATIDLGVSLVHVRQPNQGPAAARNHGVRRATGQLVVFIDDDVVATPGLLQAHVDAHRRLGDNSVVVGPMLDPPDHQLSPWVAWEQAMLAKQYAALERGEYEATALQFYTGNASVRAEHLRRAGGFDESLLRAEDIELAFRLADLGLGFHYEGAAIGWHYAARSYESWSAAARMYGRNAMIFARDRGQPWMYGFVRDSFRRQHRAVRVLAHLAATPLGYRVVGPVVQHVARLSVHRLNARVSRYALSGVYAMEYYSGAAEELGSVAAFRRVVRHGSPSIN